MRWSEFTNEAPELAATVRRVFDTGKHKVMATLRRDGSPRVSGTEVAFVDDDAWLGSMPGSVKAADLARDPRVAIHAPTVDETLKIGDAKFSGRAEEVVDPDAIADWSRKMADEQGTPVPPPPFHLFRVLVDEVVLTRVDGDHLVIETWHPGRGVTVTRRQ